MPTALTIEIPPAPQVRPSTISENVQDIIMIIDRALFRAEV